MKILHLASEYPPAQIYGLGRFVHGLARAQAARGDDVAVFTNSHGGVEDDVVKDGVRLHRIAFPNPPRPADGQGEVLQFNHGLVARYLERRDSFRDVELINSHDWLTAVAARELAADLGVPLVVTIHDEVVGKRFGDPRGQDRFVRQLEALSVHDASQVIANSGYVKRQVVRHYGVPPERVSAIPGGIDPELLSVAFPERVADFRASLALEDELLVLYVGRLDAEKGLGVLAAAARGAAARCPRLRLVLAGTGSLEPQLRRALAPLGERAQLLGYVAGERLRYLYRAADVVCVPSLYEPFGLVALEGLLAGAAVVASDTGGLAEVVEHGVSGLLVPPGDPERLADALTSLATDPLQRERLGRAGNRRAREDLSWAAIAERTQAAYSRALELPRAVCVTAPPPVSPEPVSWVLPAQPGLQELVTRTDYPALEVIVLDDGSPPTSSDVAALQGLGYAVKRLEVTGDAGGALRRGVEAASRDLVCVTREALEVPAGSEGWLRGLVWLLRDQTAGSVSPSCGEVQDPLSGSGPRRGQVGDAPVVLARRDGVLEAAGIEAAGWPGEGELAGGHWVHPVQLVRRAALHVHECNAAWPASVVLVAHDGIEDTERALQALAAHTSVPHELVLIDNGSSDGTGERFEALRAERSGQAPVQVIRNAENLGFPRAANQGIQAARGEHVVLLNNDAEVRAGWLSALLDAANNPGAGARVGAVTAKILNPDLTVQNAGGILHHPDGSFTVPYAGEDRLAPTVTERREVESTAGPCTLLTRALIEEVGLFDESYSPAYYEDSDLCQRARQAGFALLYEPGAEVVHQAQRTSVRLVREGKLDLDAVLQRNKARFHERWGDALEADEAARRLLAVSERLPRHRILLCYGQSQTTTAAYVEAALRRGHDVVTAGPGQEVDPGRPLPADELCRAAGGRFDLLLCVEGENHFPSAPWDAPCPTAVWLIDNHLHAATPDGWHFDVAAGFDHVFVAQRDSLEAFWARGVEATWLPLGCDPVVHTPALESPRADGKDLDVVFVGHVRPFHRRRRRLLDRLKRSFRVEEVQGVFREDMTALFARAKLVFNCSLAGDLNMRVFEALASGSLLLTDRIEAGLAGLFAHREHLVLYEDETLEEEVERYLSDASAREAIAARGQRLVLAHHTYGARVAALLRHVRDHARDPSRSPSRPQPRDPATAVTAEEAA